MISVDISDEEKELCSTLLSLQLYQLEPESESEVNNDINKKKKKHNQTFRSTCLQTLTGVNAGNTEVPKNGK